MCCSESLRSHGRLLLGTIGVLLVALSGTAMAGQQTQAGIIGQVKDDNGGALPGVVVTATSPSLQVPTVTDVTNQRGEYRLTPLPIGLYSVTFTLSGFQTARFDGLRLTTGFVARQDVVMMIGAIQESITVSGTAPVVDVTTSAVATQFTRESLEITPTSRTGLFSILSQLPGVRSVTIDFGGNTVTETPITGAYGRVGDAWVTMEGVSMQKPYSVNQGGNYFDQSSMEEVRSEIVGSDASWPRPGMKMSIIVKSGGNDFHGIYYGTYANHSLQGTNLSDAERARLGIAQAPQLEKRYDISGDLGGRLVRDRLWFYGSVRRAADLSIPLGGVMPDGSPALQNASTTFQTAKLSYQLTPTQRFIGFGQWVQKDETTGVGPFIPWESRTHGVVPTITTKGEWQATYGNALAISLQYGYWRYDFPRDNTAPGKVPTFDNFTQYQTGNTAGVNSISHDLRHHPKGNLTWYRPDLFFGSHEFKAGFEYSRAFDSSETVNRPTDGNYSLVFTNGAPFQLKTVNAPNYPENPVNTFSFYGSDSWALSRLRLSLGVRYAHDNGFLPEQCIPAGDWNPSACYPFIQFPIWNSIAPRLGATYDLLGNGKTMLKGSWGRYPHMRGSDEIYPGNRVAKTTTTWKWHDNNNNRAYDTGEVNLDPNLLDFVSIAGVTNLVPNPNEKQPKTDEFVVGVERELMPSFAVRATGIYRRWYDQARLQNNLRPYGVYTIPITKPDPGADGRTGTADDPGTFLTYYDYPASLRGVNFVQTSYVNDPTATQTFRTIELAATKRLSNRWQLMASYSATKKNIPYVYNSGGTNSYPTTSLDPNAEINAADRTWEWQGQLSGAYIFPHEVTASANFQSRNGLAFARTVLVTGGAQIPSIVLMAEPIGAHQLDTINIMDVRVEKTFTLRKSHKVAVRVNLFNALNSATVVSVTTQSGANFGQPDGTFASVIPARMLNFSASYRF